MELCGVPRGQGSGARESNSQGHFDVVEAGLREDVELD